MNPSPKQKKKRTRKPLTVQNFAPIAIGTHPIRWDENEVKLINWLKKRYGFDADFNLQEQLSYISSGMENFEAFIRQFPSQSESVHTLKAVQKQMTIVKSIVKDILKKFSPEKTAEMLRLLDMLFIIGSKHRSFIARNCAGGFKSLHDISSTLELLVHDNLLTKLFTNLTQSIDGLSLAEFKKLPSKRGRKKSPTEKEIIHKLIDIYIEGTHLKPTCNYHPVNEGFYGNFYFFLLCTLSLLRRKMTIKELKPDTWGDYARKTIIRHYEMKPLLNP